MNKFLLVFLFFIPVVGMKISFGQAYHPFPDTLASWSEAGGNCDEAYNPTWCWDDGWHFELVKDSIINSKNYTLLSYQQSYSYDAFFNGNYWTYISGNYPLEFPGMLLEEFVKIQERKFGSEHWAIHSLFKDFHHQKHFRRIAIFSSTILILLLVTHSVGRTMIRSYMQSIQFNF